MLVTAMIVLVERTDGRAGKLRARPVPGDLCVLPLVAAALASGAIDSAAAATSADAAGRHLASHRDGQAPA